jgi:hypothetical protein
MMMMMMMSAMSGGDKNVQTAPITPAPRPKD